MSLERIVEGLAQRLGVAAFTPDADGSYQISFDGKLKVRLAQRGRDELLLVGSLGGVPNAPGEAEHRLRETLSRSMALLHERPEIAAFDPEAEELILYRRFELGAQDPATFPDELAEFLDQLEVWSGGGAVSSPIPSPMTMMIMP